MSDRLALLIGSGEFEDTMLARLVTPAADLEVLEDVLTDPQIGRFRVVGKLFDETESQIRRHVERFFRDARSGDELLLYYSGHGVLDERGKLYLAAKDTLRDSLASTAVSAAFVSEAMDRSVAQSQVLILDCCHSGAFAKGAKAAATVSVGTSRAFAGTGRGRVILTATDDTQYAWSGNELLGEGRPSTFTSHLVDGLKTGQADLDGDGRITIADCYHYVRERSLDEGARQTPQLFPSRQSGDIVLGWTRGHGKRPRSARIPTATPVQDAALELLSVPTEITARLPGEIRLRFGPDLPRVRVSFSLNPSRLQVCGKDLNKDGEFDHQFIGHGPHETCYDLKPIGEGTNKDEAFDLRVYADGQQIFAQTYQVKLPRSSRWQSMWVKVGGSAAVLTALAGFVKFAPQLKPLFELLRSPVYSEIWSDNFQAPAGTDWPRKRNWILSGKPDIFPWRESKSMALRLGANSAALVAPAVYGTDWLGRQSVLRDFDARIEFQVGTNSDSLALIVHADASLKNGYLFLFRLRDNLPPHPAGTSHFEIEVRNLKTGKPVTLLTPVGGGVPNSDVLPRWDWYDINCLQKGRKVSFILSVHTDHLKYQDGADRDLAIGQPLPFGWFDLDPREGPIEGGTVGFLHEKGGESYVHDWCVAGQGKVCKP